MSPPPNANNDPNPRKPNSLHRKDRRPKGPQPLTRRTCSLTPRLNSLVESEKIRRNMPSASALIEQAIEHYISPDANPERGGELLAQVKRLRLDVRRLERESAERDVVLTELTAALARTFFAHVPQPTGGDMGARVAEARERYERFLDAVGRKIESGDTVLQQLPDAKLVAAGEKSSPADADPEAAE